MKILARIAVLALVLLALPLAGAARAQTIVSLTFDDGIASQYTQARSSLVSHGMHGTFYVNSGNIGANDYYMTWSNVATLAADGNEIGGHTLNHKRLSDLTTTEQRRQICDDRTALRGRGYTVTDFAYPYGAGAHNSTTRGIVRDCGYTTARMVGDLRDSEDCPDCDYAETIQPSDALAVRSTPYVSGPITLPILKNWVTQAEQHGGGWVPLMFHDFCNGCDDATVSSSDFNAFLDWLKARSGSGTFVRTVREALSGTPPPPPSDTTPPTTTISCNDAACPVTALKAPVTLGLSATDSGSGVAATRYTTDGTDPTQSSPAYSTPFSISKTTMIKYRSWDVAGNVESTHTQTVNVDSSGGSTASVAITAPKAGASVKGTVTVTVNATGPWSGVPDVDLYVDGNFTTWRSNEINPYTVPWNTAAVSTGAHTIKARVGDSLGNVYSSAPVNVTVTR